MDITLRQLEAFLAVAQNDGFTRAAERIHLTQSAVSVLVRELEGQLGVRLFDRTTRAVRLTEAGRELYPFAEKALADLATAIDNTRDLLAKKRGRVVVAAPPLIASHLLPPVIGRFQKVYPGVSVVLRDWLTDEILARVASGEVDLGIGTFHRLERELVHRPLVTDSLLLVCPKSHPLGKKKKAKWRDLAGCSVISLDRHSSLRDLVDRRLASSGCDERPAFEVSFITTAIGLVEAGLGVAVLPSYILLSTRQSNVRVRKLVDPVVKREIGMVTRRDRTLSPAAESFAEFARGEIRKGFPSDAR
jgi:LysR family transcriptional regulator, carnitine catabolism transcriptional activator